MKRIKEYLSGQPQENIVVKGWVRTKRGNKNVAFIALNDGSTINNIQVVCDLQQFDETLMKQITTGACSCVRGDLVPSMGSGQAVEVQAREIEIYGTADVETYPLQKKGHSMEFLREIAHLRPRTNTFGAVLRIRHAMAFAIHKFFNDKGFFYLHTPLITASDAEGAGEMFQVTTLDIENPPRTEDGKVDYSQDFFGRVTSLTVSGQLEGELGAMALGNIYPFEGLFVNPALTVNIVRWGSLASGNKLTAGSFSDWKDCWVMLDEAGDTAAAEGSLPPAVTEPASGETAQTLTETTVPEKVMPEKPVVSVSSEEEVVISYQACENASYYNLRVYNSEHQVAYCVGVCADANPYNECRVFTDTSFSHVFEPGSYYVRVTAVNKADGTAVASDAVPFEVKLPEYAGSGDLDGNDYINAADVRLMVRCIGGNADLKQPGLLAADINGDGIVSAADLSLLKQAVFAQEKSA